MRKTAAIIRLWAKIKKTSMQRQGEYLVDKDLLIELLERIKKDPKAKEAFDQAGALTSTEKMIVFLSDQAKRLGYELSRHDIEQEITAAEEHRKISTEAAIAVVERLSDDVIAQAVGGNDNQHGNCKDTYLDKENCWKTDGCDKNYQAYDGYKCAHNQTGAACGFKNSVKCDDLLSMSQCFESPFCYIGPLG